MGAWGEEPWDNDSAADFFGDLWEGNPVVERTLAALRSGDGDVMVAALWFCTELCRVYVWPIDQLDETLTAAIVAADHLLAGDDEDGFLEMWDEAEVDMRPAIQERRAILAARREGAGPV